MSLSYSASVRPFPFPIFLASISICRALRLAHCRPPPLRMGFSSTSPSWCRTNEKAPDRTLRNALSRREISTKFRALLLWLGLVAKGDNVVLALAMPAVLLSGVHVISPGTLSRAHYQPSLPCGFCKHLRTFRGVPCGWTGMTCEGLRPI